MYRFISLFIALLFLGFSGCGSSSTTAEKPASKKKELLISEILERGDLPDTVRKSLESLASSGTVTTVKQSYLDQMMMVAEGTREKASLATPPSQPKSSLSVKTKFAMSRGSLESKIPTLSRSKYTGPIKYATTPTTYRDSYAGFASLRQRGIDQFQQTEVYKLTAADKASAIKVMESILEEMARPKDEERWKVLSDEATALEAKSLGLSLDPIFLKYCGIALGNSGKANEGAKRLQKSVDEFTKSNYPSWEVIDVTHRLFENQGDRVGKTTKINQFAHLGVTVKHWLTEDFQMEPHQHASALKTYRMFVDLLKLNDDWKMINDVHETVAANTDLPPWLRAMLRADHERSVGLYYRGTGMPDTVSKEHWGYFEVRVKQAASFYKEAFEITPWLPESSEGMLSLAQYGYLKEVDGKNPRDYWFDQVMGAAPYHYDACTSMIFALLPQWGGSIEQMYAFTKEQAFKGEDKSLLPFLPIYCFYTIRGNATGDLKERIKFTESQEFIRDMFRGLDLIIENIDEQGIFINDKFRDKYFFMSMKGILAKQLGVVDVAEKTLGKLGENLDMDAVGITGIRASSLESFRSRDHAMTGEFSPEAEELTTLMKGGLKARLKNAKRIVEICGTVLRETDATLTKVYFSKMKRKVQAEWDFDVGRQIELEVAKELELWGSNSPEQIEFENSKTLKIDNTQKEAGFRVSANVECPGSKVVEFDLEYPQANSPGLFNGNDLVPSLVPYIIKEGESHEFVTMGLSVSPKPVRLKNNKFSSLIGTLFVGSYYSRNKPAPMYIAVPSKKVHFKYIVQPEFCEIYVNDSFIRRVLFPKDMDVEIKNTFEISHPTIRKGAGILKVSNVRIKKWSDKAPVFKGEAKELVAYYEKVLKDHPKDAWMTFWYAKALHRSERFAEAIDVYKDAVKLGIDKADVAFYLGDAYERNGDYETAGKVYVAGSAASPTNVGLHLNLNSLMHSNQNWSSYRNAWRVLTSPDPKIRADYDESKFAMPIPPGVNSWTSDLLKAQKLAVGGKFEEAKKQAQKAIVRCNSEQEQVVLPIIEAYSKKKTFTQPWNEKPVYQELDKQFDLYK